MGLDMYLRKMVYVGANYSHRCVSVKIEINIGDQAVKVNPAKIAYIIEEAGYWRKANAIHNWFVTNVQDGDDNCQEHDVSYEQLQELRKLCKKVIKSKDATLLPPSAGFFFGSTEADDYYFQNLKETVKIIDSLDPEGDYSYRSSW